MHTQILTCGALAPYVRAAQAAMQTHYPVTEVDRNYHEHPNKLRAMLTDALGQLPEDTETVLVGMGACGNAWEGISWRGKLVIPKMDDCVTILLHTGDEWQPNRKLPGHFYQIDEDDAMCLTASYEKAVAQYGEKKARMLNQVMYGSYTNIDIVDTGVFDCHDAAFVERNQRDAALIQATLGFVPGSNRIMEKLVSGVWDHQFLIVEPGTVIRGGDFLDQA